MGLLQGYDDQWLTSYRADIDTGRANGRVTDSRQSTSEQVRALVSSSASVSHTEQPCAYDHMKYALEGCKVIDKPSSYVLLAFIPHVVYPY